jgi:hypothetical protein
MAIFLFFPKHLWVLKWALLFIERKGWSSCDYSEYSSNLLLAFASKVIFGFGPIGLCPDSAEQSSNFLLGFVSTVILGRGPHWDPYKYFRVFQGYLHVLK